MDDAAERLVALSLAPDATPAEEQQRLREDLAAALARAVAAEDGAALARLADSLKALRPAIPRLAAFNSPTKDVEELEANDGYWGLLGAPASFATAAVRASFAPVLAAARAPAHKTGRSLLASLVAETAMYTEAVASLPSHVRAEERQRTSANLLGAAALVTDRWSFASKCPELATSEREADARLPGVQGEVKSVDATTLMQAVYSMLMDITRRYFSPAGALERVFFAAPPRAFAVLGFPCAGHFLSVEVIGKALVAPASEALVLGSAAHAAALAALPAGAGGGGGAAAAGAVLVAAAVLAPSPRAWTFDPALRWFAPRRSGASPSVCWSVGGGRFRKLVRADARSAEAWAEMHAAYSALEALTAPARAPPPPPAITRGTRLLYGQHEVLVEMAAVRGDEASEAQLGLGPGGWLEDAELLARIADGIAWLAAHGLVYTDVRGPNALLDTDARTAFLVDFDDAVVVPAPVRSAEALADALRGIARARAERDAAARAGDGEGAFAPRAVEGRFPELFAAGRVPKLRAALEAAFARLDESEAAAEAAAAAAAAAAATAAAALAAAAQLAAAP